MIVHSDKAAELWTAFSKGVRQELILMDSVYRPRGWLTTLSQKCSVSSYKNEFMKTVIGNLGTREEEKLDNSCPGPKVYDPL